MYYMLNSGIRRSSLRSVWRAILGAAVLLLDSVVTLPAAPIPVRAVGKGADDVTLTLPSGVMKLTICSDSIVRVMYSPNATFPAGQDFVVTNRAWPKTSFDVADEDGRVVVSTCKLRITVDKSSGAVSFYDVSGKRLLAEPAGGGKVMTAATVNGESSFQPEQTFVSPDDEFIHGLGQYQEGVWNWRGMPQQLRQLNTQIAAPMIVSSYGYGLLWNNASLTEFNPADTQVELNGKTGSFTTSGAGDYVFFVKDGDRKNLIGVQVNGETVASVENMWVPYTLCCKVALPANAKCSVTLLGGGDKAKIYARPIGSATTFRSEVGGMIDYYFFYGPTADEIISGYRLATGDAPMFPKSAYGFWQCRERYSSQEEMLAAARRFRADSIPVDYIVQDWQYWGPHGWGAYEWDLKNYPAPADMIAQLHAMHFKYMISVWSNPGGIVGKALSSMQNGLIPDSTWMDVYNPAVRSLRWKYMDSAFFGIGTDAWWQDATEPGDDGNSVNGVPCFAGSANRVRNSYPLFANEAAYEGQRATDPGKRVVILSRSAYPGQQRYAAAVWSGDIKGDWLTFARQIGAGLNFSLTGMPYWTTDTGGFFHPRDQYASADYNELLARWFEWSAFCPILRIHGFMTSTEVWNWQPRTQAALVAYDQFRYRMLPYNYSVAWKITSERYTPMRALMMDFPNDANVRAISDEYMFGPAFLVCPVTKPQATGRDVYLPSGANWVDFWTGETLSGGKTLAANAPLNILPLYVRAGSIVPLGPVMQYANEKPADPIELRVYCGADGRFTLYGDEGDNYNYEKGEYAVIPLEWNEAGQTLTIGKRRGGFPGMMKEFTFRIVFVSPGRGTGMDPETHPDALVRYTGEAVIVGRLKQSLVR
jgi:alpha-D-xyloside xylohydrolase